MQATHSESAHLHSPQHPHREGAAACCVRLVAITLLAVSIMGIVSGVFAYLVAGGHYTTTLPILLTLGSIGVPHSYVVIGGSVTVCAVAAFSFIYNCQASSCCVNQPS